MSTTTISTKRPHDLTDFASEILSDPIKRQRLQAITKLSPLGTGAIPKSPDQSTNSDELNPFRPTSHTDLEKSQLHNLPENSIPVIESPYEVDQFFTDYGFQTSDQYNEVVKNMVHMFPPPRPPTMPGSGAYESIMIPFIFPPPPVIKPSPYIDDNERFMKKAEPELDDDSYASRLRSARSKDQDQDQTESEPEIEYPPVELAPLLFPPPNFMPYPLNANKSTITPHDLFTDFLDASLLLPRIDMVLASAAGSLADLRVQAQDEGFDIAEHENEFRQRQLHGEDEMSEVNESEDERAREETRDYYDNIDVSNQFDKKSHGIYYPFEGYVSPFVQVLSKLSNVKNKKVPQSTTATKTSDLNGDLPNFKQVLSATEPYNYRDSSEKKRRILQNSVTRLEHISDDYKLEQIRLRKQELAAKIKSLRNSQISITDYDNSSIESEELVDIKTKLDTKRDLDLVKLKVETDYEKLREAISYYSDTDKVYKKYNTTVTNKLLKLKNFFEYQEKCISSLISNPKQFNELVDLNNKDSTKLFGDVIDRDYKKDLRKLIRFSTKGAKEADEEDEDEEDEETKEVETVESLANNIKRNKFPAGLETNVEVSDLMPLISTKEFNLITSNIKANSDLKVNLNHQIFKSAIYESGSDSNYTSQGPEAPKRRGRRANIPAEVDEDSLNSEAYLLAKITKQFIGPQAVSSQEMDDDIKSMGATTKGNNKV